MTSPLNQLCKQSASVFRRSFLDEGCVDSQLRCVKCESLFSLSYDGLRCACGSLLEIVHPRFSQELTSTFDKRMSSLDDLDISGVWRFREGVLPQVGETVCSHPEGNTRLYRRKQFSRYTGVHRVLLKHEGENPTGSFKDRGMTVAVTQAQLKQKRCVGCASTGNTSAALAAYAAQAEGMQAYVFLPDGHVAAGKLAQAQAYGACCVSVPGDFDEAMRQVQMAASQVGLYLVNSVNPFRLEGQKTIMWELFQQLAWQPPDWIVVPGGNLGNTSAFGKAIREAYEAGWIPSRPRLAVVQAQGANPFHASFENSFSELVPQKADTIATAIRIGNPVNFEKACMEIRELNGVVISVSDEEIRQAKAVIDSCGVGCEPASACSLAGIRALHHSGVIDPDEHVVGILTGHLLKDPDLALDIANSEIGKAEFIRLEDGFSALLRHMDRGCSRKE